MNKKRALVIGAGIGGLSAALRMKSKGYEVEVFEKSAAPGGKIAELRHDGFRFDTGPSLFTLPFLVEELFALFGKETRKYLEVLELEVSCKYFFPDGMVLNAWSNKEQFIEEVSRKGFDPEVLETYLERQSFLYNYTADFFLFNSIHKASTYVGEAGQKSLKALHKLDALNTMHQRNTKTFGASNLTQLFDRYATYNGSDPYRAPATLNMIAHLEHNTGAYFPANGMFGIVKALTKLAKEEGVQFNYNTEVSEVLLNGKTVVGIRVDNKHIKADVVINDTDVSYFYRHLLPVKRMLKKLQKRERSSSALIFYWGVNMESPMLDVHNILFAQDYKAEFEGLFKTKLFANDLTVYIFISKKIVDTDAPAGCENWFVMVNAPENVGQDWAAQTQKARSIILQKINSVLNIDIEKHIKSENVVTPVDIEARTASVGGSLYGHSSNGAMAAFLRHPNFSKKYKNLYFVGGSVHPGGGIPLCLASAKIVSGLIFNCK